MNFSQTNDYDMKLFEHIDQILLESVRNLGFSDDVASVIEDEISSGRKNQHYLAQYFKHWELTSRANEPIIYNVSLQALRAFEDMDADWKDFLIKLRAKYGLRGEKTRYTDSPINEIENEFASKLESINDVLTLRKKSRKALKKMELVSNDDIRKFLTKFDNGIARAFKKFTIRNKELIDYLNKDSNNYVNLKGEGLESAKEIAKMNYASDEDKLIKFSDGWFWYAIETEEECRREGDRMGHCGRMSFSGDTMYSLRDPKNNPHVTIEFGPPNTIIQLKGKGNEIPKDKYTKYIKEFIKETNAFVEEDWHRTGSPEVKDYLDEITSSHGSHNYSLFSRKAEDLGRWIRESLTDWESMMEERTGRVIRTIGTSGDYEREEIGDYDLTCYVSGEIPFSMIIDDDYDFNRVEEVINEKWEWLEDYSDEWMFDGNNGEMFDYFSWVDGPMAVEGENTFIMEGFEMELHLRHNRDRSSEETEEKLITALESLSRGWTEENLIKGARKAMERFIIPELE